VLTQVITNILRKDRLCSVLALVAVSIVAWVYTIMGVGMNMSALTMTAMPGDMPMPLGVWDIVGSVLMFAMWWVMMIAMMLPSAAPMLLLFQHVSNRREAGLGSINTAVFAMGYLLIWGLFSALATVLHAFGEATGFINGMMVSASIYLSAALQIIAGIWQLAPQKYKCLDACRNPVEFLSLIWRPGRLGALRAGLLHGAFCVGCCWAMMLLLFVGGVMNLYWIGGLALFVLAEKTLPLWHVTGRISGVAAIIVGVVVLVIA
jgi:predicted metal-binding membrane protein